MEEVSAMKIRVKFEKTGALKYIGHLDVMRFFQKLNRRAMIPVAYSEGFSPHQILSFSPPLSLGAQSFGEYADMEVAEGITSQVAIDRLNAQTVDGIKILSFRKLPEKALNAMAAVTAARYICSLKEGIGYTGNICEDLSSLMDRDEIIVEKKTKKNEVTIDIKPLIYEFKILDKTEGKAEFLLSAGSVNNLKPELIYNAIFAEKGFEASEHFLDIIRVDLYTGDKENLVSLDDVGSDIE